MCRKTRSKEPRPPLLRVIVVGVNADKSPARGVCDQPRSSMTQSAAVLELLMDEGPRRRPVGAWAGCWSSTAIISGSWPAR